MLRKIFAAGAVALALLFAVVAFPPPLAYAQAAAPAVTVDAGGTTTVTTPDQVTAVSAPDATTVVVPAGLWIDDLVKNGATIIDTLLLAAFAWLLRKLPAGISDILRTMQVEQLLTRAVDYALNATAGATKGLALRFDVHNAAVASALQYVIDHGPGWLIGWMGGAEMIKEKLVARIPLDAGSAVINDSTGPVAINAAGG